MWYIVLLFWSPEGLYVQEPYWPRSNDSYKKCMEWIPWGTPLLEKHASDREWILECVFANSSDHAQALVKNNHTP